MPTQHCCSVPLHCSLPEDEIGSCVNFVLLEFGCQTHGAFAVFKQNFSHALSIIGDMLSALGLVQTVVGGIQYMVIVSFTLFELEYWMYTNRKKKTLP